MYDLSNRLISSCDELFANNEITELQYITCKTEIDDNGYSKKINLTEKNILNTNRNLKKEKFNDFINNIEILKEQIFEKLKNDTTKNDISNTKIDTKYYTILVLLNGIIIDIIENISKKSVEKYKTKEDSQYKMLLEYYNKIDTNRKEIDSINKKYNTLEKMNNIQDNKLNNIKNNKNTIFIILVVMYILTFLLLTIFLIIYFK